MRICLVADGSSIHTQRWLNYFARKGHEVHLICWKLMPGYDNGVHIHWLTRLAPRIWRVSQYFSAFLWILQVRQIVNKIKPDIVDGHFITVYGFLAACAGFHPLVVSAWGSDVLIYARHNPLFRATANYALKRADMVIYDSQSVRKELVKLDAKQEKLRLIFWGVDTKQFNPQQGDKELRSKLGLSGAPTVISIRNLKPVYNVEMLIKAIPLVLNQVPETKFIIAGDGEQREDLKNLATSLAVSHSINFASWIPHDELPKYLASSDIYVSTSLSDSTSLSLQEAMACELAPVVTDLSANREWITDGENGFLVPINDPKTLADKIILLIKNKGIGEEFGRRARKVVEEKAQYHKEMARMEKIYQELAWK